ncbi:hypothetical protein Ddye_007117 [Dipteronia dyeriana]|uniref:Alpha/beta hydrolase fold-3 domain-containing protein n=1 Tax=Dipteronia dyeriana TaxID=168575 RepID=A0AAD9XJC1_9ROSI|nr:hypothetical protein Ddye_007117 [Dipteronia dyeriana]
MRNFAAYKLKSHGLNVMVFEAEGRAGGKLSSISKDGLVWDEGANTMVDILGTYYLFYCMKRFDAEIVHASSDHQSSNGYKFKDVIIDPSKAITGRIFHPDDHHSPHLSSGRLPVLVYFHGGGFCIGSTTWLGFHHFLGDFSVASQSIVLSIDYRLAPENRLPGAYDDCFYSHERLSHQVSSEPWLAQADLHGLFLSGDSASGNIAHQVAIRAMRNKALDVKIKGLL